MRRAVSAIIREGYVNGETPGPLQDTEEARSLRQILSICAYPAGKEDSGAEHYGVSTGDVTTPTGDSDIHLVAALDFETVAALKLGLASPEGQAAAGDLANFADGGVDLLIFDTKESDSRNADRSGPTRLTNRLRAGRDRSSAINLLLTGRAGVHVDFHADLHFHDLRSLPAHLGLLRVCAKIAHDHDKQSRRRLST
jgi:uncharacterized protein (TIGR02118 family)